MVRKTKMQKYVSSLKEIMLDAKYRKNTLRLSELVKENKRILRELKKENKKNLERQAELERAEKENIFC